MLSEITNFLNFNDTIACAGLPTKDQFMDIKAAGFCLVINLGLHDDPVYSLPGEAENLKALEIKYVHIPILFDHPTHRDIEDFFNVMEANKGARIFVHCAMNIRASTFLGLYGILHLNLPSETAFEPMRKIWRPDAIWQEFIDSMLTRFTTG